MCAKGRKASGGKFSRDHLAGSDGQAKNQEAKVTGIGRASLHRNFHRADGPVRKHRGRLPLLVD